MTSSQSRRDFLKTGAAVATAALLPTAQAAAQARTPFSITEGQHHMSTFTTKDGVQIYYKDWGGGQPIGFHHGWPLSSDAWDRQMLFFLPHGYGGFPTDRRG